MPSPTRVIPQIDLIVQTCESRAQSRRVVPFVPPPNSSPFSPFEAKDPFDVRKAVLPVFKRTPDGVLLGMGTSVHLDGWGGFLTAEHVIEFLHSETSRGSIADTFTLDPRARSHAVVMLGIGATYGKTAIPEWAFAPVTEALRIVHRREDPLAALGMEPNIAIGVDIAGFQALLPPDAYGGDRAPPRTLAAKLTNWTPIVGQTVLAFGYPELKPREPVSDATLHTLIEDGLFAVYGTITELYPNGRSSTNPTPVFGVQSNWPSGMSGGPVVNQEGFVVGIVSRSLSSDGDRPGVGYAACLPWIDEIRQLAPRIDPYNPGFRLGYGVQGARGVMRGVWPTPDLALQQGGSGEGSGQVAPCSHRMGTDEFVLFPDWPTS